MPKMKNDSLIIHGEIYKKVLTAIKKNERKFLLAVNKFFNVRHDQVHAIAPYDRILYNQRDIDDIFNALDLNEKEILVMMKNCPYYSIPNNPQNPKEPITIVLYCIARYYLKSNNRKKAELVTTYLAFTGKFYASIHGLLWKKFPPLQYKEVMDFVINNVLSEHFLLKSEGTLFKAIMKLVQSFLDKYEKSIKADDTTDNEIAGPNGILQTLRDREKFMLKNVASAYYEAFENRNYLNYEQDNLEDGSKFRITDNDAARAARLTDNVINYLMSTTVSLDVCNKAKNELIGSMEIKDIIETIMSNKDNIPVLKNVITILICDYFRAYPKGDVASLEFVAYSFKQKPNVKDKYVLEMRQAIYDLLEDSSANYRKRKNNKNRKGAYHRAILYYIVLTINKVARK